MLLTILVIVFVCSGIFVYNQLIRQKLLVSEATSGIDVQLKRRHDLIPNLVETVKGYAQHEKKVLEALTLLRAQATADSSLTEKTKLENDISAGLKRIFAIVENYPDLKANQNFLELQKNLSAIEDEIQLARRYYNGTVRDYNTAVQSFPNNLLANAFNFKSAQFFEIEYATERATPDVKF